MPTLLFVDHATGMGGAEFSLLWLMEALARRGFAVHLAAPSGPLAEAAADQGFCWHRLDFPRLRRSSRALADWWLTAGRLAGLTRTLPSPLLYANTVRAALYAALAARRSSLPFVWHMRDFWLGENPPARRWLDRWGKTLLCAAATTVITNSQAVAHNLPCREKVTVVYNGIRADDFGPWLDGTPFRRAHGIPVSALVVGTVGRLRPWKGQKLFLQAMLLVAEAVPEARFLVVGGTPLGAEPEYVQVLHDMATERPLRGRVVFSGQLTDVRPALAAMDVFVHAGEPEPFGLVNLEAMAMARPVVAFAHGALPEIVAAGKTGLLLPPGETAVLAEAVVTLLREPERRRRLGLAGRQRVLDRFTVEQTCWGVMAVLEAVMPT